MPLNARFVYSRFHKTAIFPPLKKAKKYLAPAADHRCQFFKNRFSLPAKIIPLVLWMRYPQLDIFEKLEKLQKSE